MVTVLLLIGWGNQDRQVKGDTLLVREVMMGERVSLVVRRVERAMTA